MVYGRILFALIFLLVSACSDSDSYEVGIIKPLMVIGMEPGGADNVPLDAVLKVRFTDNVIEGSLTAESVVLSDEQGANIAGEIAYEASERMLTFTPVTPLSYTATYTLTLTKAIKRKSDQAVLAKEFTHTFKTIDPPMLTVVSSTPSGGATSIGVFVDSAGVASPYGDSAEASLVITFSEGIDADTVTPNTVVVKSAEGTTVSGSFAWAASDIQAEDLLGNKIGADDILTFTPDAPLALSTEYIVTLKGTHAGIRTKRATEEGGYFENDVSWTFRTIDPPPLRVLWTSPSTDAVNVGAFMAPDGSLSPYGGRATQEVVIRLSEGAATDTVLANFHVFAVGSTAPIAGALRFSNSGPEFWQQNDTILFLPASWDLSREYLVVLGKDAESFRATATGGQLGADFGIQFMTLDPPPLRVLWSSPSDGAVNVGTLQPDVYGTDVAQAITIRFSEALDVATINTNLAVVEAETGTPVPGTVALVNSGGAFWQQNDTVVFTPARWDLSQNYMVTVGGGVQSARATSVSGALGAAFSIGFDANDPLPLFLEATFPGNGAQLADQFITDVNGGTNNGDVAVVALNLYFSEAVDPSSVEANFALEENGVDITPLLSPADFAYGMAGTQVTVTLPNLKLSSTYRVRLQAVRLPRPLAAF